jgi:hypothetical protein
MPLQPCTKPFQPHLWSVANYLSVTVGIFNLLTLCLERVGDAVLTSERLPLLMRLHLHAAYYALSASQEAVELEKCIFCRHLAHQKGKVLRGKVPTQDQTVTVPPSEPGEKRGQLKRCSSWPSALQPWLSLKEEDEIVVTSSHSRLKRGFGESPGPGSFRKEMADLLEGFPPNMRDFTPTPQRHQARREEAPRSLAGSMSARRPAPAAGLPNLFDSIVHGLTMGITTPSKAAPPSSSPAVSRSLRTQRSSRPPSNDDSDGRMYRW